MVNKGVRSISYDNYVMLFETTNNNLLINEGNCKSSACIKASYIASYKIKSQKPTYAIYKTKKAQTET